MATELFESTAVVPLSMFSLSRFTTIVELDVGRWSIIDAGINGVFVPTILYSWATTHTSSITAPVNSTASAVID